MNIQIVEFEMNTCIKENEIFVVLYDKTFISESEVNNLIHASVMSLYDYQLPVYRSCVFMTKDTYDNVFKSLKGRVH